MSELAFLAPPIMPTPEHRPADLILLFNTLFASVENTRLVLGGSEPVYIPANQESSYHQLVFAHGFFSSALHEISHWCIAGKQRRLQLDYGYWYAADGRNRQQQQAFEHVEIKPQALEWILSKACGMSFRISADNLSGEETDTAPFKCAVHSQVLAYCQQGLPPRAQLLLQCLLAFYQRVSDDESHWLTITPFELSELG